MMRCTYCGSHLHTVENCPKTWDGSAARTRMRCSYCGDRDHRADSCPKIVAQHNRKPNSYFLD